MKVDIGLKIAPQVPLRTSGKPEMNKKLMIGIAGGVVAAIGGGALLLGGGASAALRVGHQARIWQVRNFRTEL